MSPGEIESQKESGTTASTINSGATHAPAEWTEVMRKGAKAATPSPHQDVPNKGGYKIYPKAAAAGTGTAEAAATTYAEAAAIAKAGTSSNSSWSNNSSNNLKTRSTSSTNSSLNSSSRRR